MHIQRSNGVQRALLTVVLTVMVAFTSCHRSPRLPGKNSKTYADMVSAFYIGLAALQVGDDVHAESKLSEATQLVPGEPAGVGQLGSAGVAAKKLRCGRSETGEGTRSGAEKRSNL